MSEWTKWTKEVQRNAKEGGTYPPEGLSCPNRRYYDASGCTCLACAERSANLPVSKLTPLEGFRNVLQEPYPEHLMWKGGQRPRCG